MSIEAFFGWFSILVCTIAWRSKDVPIQKLSLLLFGSWMASNILYGTTSPPRIMTFNALLDISCLAMATMALIRSPHKNTMAAIIGVYVLMLASHFFCLVAWYLFKVGDFTYYYRTLNIMFLAQLLVAGVSGGACILARFNRDRHHPAHRPIRGAGAGK